mmetsp:Transcript_97519/g.303729  ORF Transcript_97519/g.303729 Transcript_97519/m.303729 type:complete len:207 (-) Transcript_97519:943-1563(-)
MQGMPTAKPASMLARPDKMGVCSSFTSLAMRASRRPRSTSVSLAEVRSALSAMPMVTKLKARSMRVQSVIVKSNQFHLRSRPHQYARHPSIEIFSTNSNTKTTPKVASRASHPGQSGERSMLTPRVAMLMTTVMPTTRFSSAILRICLVWAKSVVVVLSETALGWFLVTLAMTSSAPFWRSVWRTTVSASTASGSTLTSRSGMVTK